MALTRHLHTYLFLCRVDSGQQTTEFLEKKRLRIIEEFPFFFLLCSMFISELNARIEASKQTRSIVAQIDGYKMLSYHRETALQGAL